MSSFWRYVSFVVLIFTCLTFTHAHVDSIHYVDMPRDCVIYDIGAVSGYYIEPMEYHCELSSNVKMQEVGTTLIVGRRAYDVRVERKFRLTGVSNTNAVDLEVRASLHLASMNVELFLTIGLDTIALADTASSMVVDTVDYSDFATLEMDPTFHWRLHSRGDFDIASARTVYASINGTQARNGLLHVQYSLSPRVVPNDWTRSYVYRLAGNFLDSNKVPLLRWDVQAEFATVTTDTNAMGAFFATVHPQLSIWQHLVLELRLPFMLFGVFLGALLFPCITSIQELKWSQTRHSLLLLFVASLGYLIWIGNEVPFHGIYDFMDGHYNWRKYRLLFGLTFLGAWVTLIFSILGYLFAWMIVNEGQTRKNRISHELN